MMLTEPFAAFREVKFFASLDDETLTELCKFARFRRFPPGRTMVSELELGADVFVIANGEAEVSVTPRTGQKQRLGRLLRGSTFGEMASLTGELRSATVTAVTAVEAWVITDRDFDRLRERRPEIAVQLVRTLAERLGEADRMLEALARSPESANRSNARPPDPRTKRALSSGKPRAWKVLWRDLVVNRQKELPFLILAAFVLTLLAVRAAVFVSFSWDWAPFGVLRIAYTTGFALLLLSAGASLFTFRPRWRRGVALTFGVGLALVLNQLGVTLAFDIFYKDIKTPDPNVPFDVEQLYRRTEALRAIVIGLVVLVQAAYLRRFYGRILFRIRLGMAAAMGRRR